MSKLVIIFDQQKITRSPRPEQLRKQQRLACGTVSLHAGQTGNARSANTIHGGHNAAKASYEALVQDFDDLK